MNENFPEIDEAQQSPSSLNTKKATLRYIIVKLLTDTNRGKQWEDFPGGAVVKNPPANAGDMGSIPGPGDRKSTRLNSVTQ